MRPEQRSLVFTRWVGEAIEARNLRLEDGFRAHLIVDRRAARADGGEPRSRAD